LRKESVTCKKYSRPAQGRIEGNKSRLRAKTTTTNKKPRQVYRVVTLPIERQSIRGYQAGTTPVSPEFHKDMNRIVQVVSSPGQTTRRLRADRAREMRFPGLAFLIHPMHHCSFTSTLKSTVLG
jgi:hypothetical protein